VLAMGYRPVGVAPSVLASWPFDSALALPIFVNGLCWQPAVTFTYVDSGAETIEAFSTHLRAYFAMF
jgi:hypothetical protein